MNVKSKSALCKLWIKLFPPRRFFAETLVVLLLQQFYGSQQCHAVDEALKIDEIFIYAPDFILQPLQPEHEVAVCAECVAYFMKGLVVLPLELLVMQVGFSVLHGKIVL